MALSLGKKSVEELEEMLQKERFLTEKNEIVKELIGRYEDYYLQIAQSSKTKDEGGIFSRFKKPKIL